MKEAYRSGGKVRKFKKHSELSRTELPQNMKGS